MKTLIRIAETLFRILLPWAVAVAACYALFSCRGVQYVPVEKTSVDSVRVVDIQRDSIYILDSIYVREAHDTVYITKWRVEYREALKVDTFLVQRVDSINTVVEVEKKLTKIQQLKMDIGAGVLWAIPIIIALYLLYRRFLK